MSTYSFEQLGPVLVSELPPVGPRPPGLVARLRSQARHRLEERTFELALRSAVPAEHTDLIAVSRRG